ncbi:isochorismatase family protein [Rhodoligotrophos defluvii]|uniref:isochorismatase family protein n=1 Tax=Rhodoligotrophos defluvii TaxID=2561934 RepID=UPI0010C9DF15|nr:isochorismatase family protein [Rhodoligotrophos defluvii]
MRRPLSIDPARTAGLFIDLQEEHRQDPRYLVAGFESVLRNVRRLQEAERRNGVLLCHCSYVVDLAAEAKSFHPVMADGRSAFSAKGDPWTALCPEVAPAPGELHFVKSEASAFGSPQLAMALAERRVEWLVVAGVWTEACVDATVKDAIAAGLRVLLVKDACGSGTAAMHQTGVLNLANRLYGGAVTDTDGACRLLDGETVEVWQVEGSVPLRFTFETAEPLYRSL